MQKNQIPIHGIDAVKITTAYTQPFMEHSVDYSGNPDVWDEAIQFLESKSHLDLFFEVVFSE